MATYVIINSYIHLGKEMVNIWLRIRHYVYFQTDATTQLFVRAIRTLCIAANSPCASAVLQLEADADCTTALGDDDTENYCTGTCRDLIDALLDSCALV